MKVFRLVSVVVLTLTLGGVANAATEKDTSNRDENGKIVRGPYATAGADANWFIGFGGGFNMFTNVKNNFTPDFTPSLDVYFGKWFDPNFGARVGYQGLTGAMNPPEGSAADANDREHFGFAYIHADVLWNISNTIGGYRSNRLWEFVPYAHFGVFRLYQHEGVIDPNHRVNPSDNEFAGGVGLINKIFLHKRVNLMWDTRMFVVSGRFHDWAVGGFCYNLSSTIGLSINLGKTGFSRVSDATTPISSALADAEAALAAARDANDSLSNALSDALAEAGKKGDTKIIRDTVAVNDTLVVENSVKVVLPLVVFFEKNAYKLDVASQKQIDFYIETIYKQDPTRVLYVSASADKSTGNDEINQRVCAKRVEYTIKYIHEKFGVPMEQLKEGSKTISDFFSDVRLDRTVKIDY